MLPGLASSGLMASTFTLEPPEPPDTEVETVAESPNGIESPTRKPVFFTPVSVVNAVAKIDASRHPVDRVADRMSERSPFASMLCTKLPVRLARPNGSGAPTEMRLKAFGGRALVNIDVLIALVIDAERSTNELTSNGLVVSVCCCRRAVTDARSS